MSIRRHPHLLTFAATAVAVLVAGTFTYIAFAPRLMYNAVQKAAKIPVNSLYTEPQLASPTTTRSAVLIDGTNHDTLYTLGRLDLGVGPELLSVPDMGGRYYSIQFVNPSDGTDFAYVGRRTTGTSPGTYLVAGPEWQGTPPAGTPRISSPGNQVLLIGRVLVENNADLPTAYTLSRAIKLTRY